MTLFSSPKGTCKPRPSPWGALFIAAVSAVILAGCATIPKEVLETEPSAYLEKEPQIYMRLSGSALRDIASSMKQEELLTLAGLFSDQSVSSGIAAGADRSSGKSSAQTMDTSMLKSFLAKTRTFGAGFRGLGTKAPDMEAVFVGDFPVISVRLALVLNGEWEKAGDGGYSSVKYPLFIRPPQPGVIHASTSMAAGASLSAEAFPQRLAALSSSEIFLSINSPASLLANPIQREALALPVGAIVIAGRQADVAAPTEPESRYLLDVYILMNDEATAKAYKPVVRFLWTAAAGRLFGDNPNISSSQLVLEKDIYVARGIEVSTSAFKAMITSSLVGR